ncbi:hypothetical protein [Colwellia sp. 20A7]|uniref:hypothetical protein n=1 Tax=Colwellia sp. 20A7 TaxID=2689569 RepID=UPI00135C7E8B|nr:hypothetical protein [Colwellia sp. 20A7]
MRKLLSSPVKMPLSAAENQIYQNVLKYFTPLSLNLMAVKVVNRPDEFTGWCREFIRLCREELNMELLDEEQFLPLKKLQDSLEAGFTISQCKMARIAPWPIFIGFVEQQNELHALDERLRLLNYVKNNCQLPLADLSLEDRLVFAGKHTANHVYHTYNFDTEWFASTKGAKLFHLLLEQCPEKFDVALAHIPLTGDVNYDEYQKFVTDFQKIFSDYAQEQSADSSVKSKAPLPAATRLLAMRRPDQFIALNNNKIDMFCKGLSIVKFSNTDFSSYWHDMIGTLRTLPWWNQAEPEQTITDSNTAESLDDNSSDVSSTIGTDVITEQEEAIDEKDNTNLELTIWHNRAILIDLFLFADADLSQNSNYIRARDKALNKAPKKSNTTFRKNSKETVEEMVDKALMSEDLPEYMLSKRDSIIAQVKKGKSVEKVIALMRAIFG